MPWHGGGLIGGEGTVIFWVRWSFSSPLVLTPLNHCLSCFIPWFPILCCHLYFFLFHLGFQMVEGSCIQQLTDKICHDLVHFPCELEVRPRPVSSLSLSNKCQHENARELYYVMVLEMTNCSKAAPSLQIYLYF